MRKLYLTVSNQDIKTFHNVEIQEYIVIVFPGYDWQSLSGDTKEVEFKNLEGGTVSSSKVRMTTNNEADL